MVVPEYSVFWYNHVVFLFYFYRLMRDENVSGCFIDCPHKIILAGLFFEFIRGDSFGGFKYLPKIIVIGISYHLRDFLHGIVRVHGQQPAGLGDAQLL